MSKPIPLQEKFTGMYRDASRDALPKGKVWNLVDYIPDLDAPLRKRGGWSYEGPLLTDLNASAGLPGIVGVAPFVGGTQVLAIDSTTRRLYDVTNSADRGVTGHANAQLTPTVFYRELFLMFDYTGSDVPKKYTGSGAPASLAGSPPNIGLAAVYKDRLLGAGVTTAQNRIYFSGAGNAESWDTNLRWIDASAPVLGLAALRNSVLVFHSGSVERIRGDIPPGSAAANMVLEPLFNDVGIAYYTSIAVFEDSCVFADKTGVYQTDGASISDLTKQGGMKTYWRSLFRDNTVYSVAIGVNRQYAFVSLLTSGDAYIDFLICELSTRSWFRCANIRARNFASVYGVTDEFYFSNRETKRVGELGSIFAPASGVKNDADGDAVTPVLETGLLSLGTQTKKRWKKTYVAYDVRDAASDNPTLTVSYLTSPEATSYTALTPTLTETTERTRKRVSLAKSTYGVALKVAQTNASSDTRLYALEADVSPQEGSRL